MRRRASESWGVGGTRDGSDWRADVLNPLLGLTIGLFVRKVGVMGLSILLSPWETEDMATNRTRADKEQRQADQLEKKSERRPEQETGKKKERKDDRQAA